MIFSERLKWKTIIFRTTTPTDMQHVYAFAPKSTPPPTISHMQVVARGERKRSQL